MRKVLCKGRDKEGNKIYELILPPGSEPLKGNVTYMKTDTDGNIHYQMITPKSKSNIILNIIIFIVCLFIIFKIMKIF
jgi:hypothetical protein